MGQARYNQSYRRDQAHVQQGFALRTVLNTRQMLDFLPQIGSGRFQVKIERLTARRTVPLPKGRPKKPEYQ